MNGYQVEPNTLNGACEAAIRIGQNISALADDVDPACAVPTDMPVGAALLAADPLWQQHFRNVGANVTATGQLLCQSSANYTAAESSISASFRSIAP